jgi:hypothetical protein
MTFRSSGAGVWRRGPTVDVGLVRARAPEDGRPAVYAGYGPYQRTEEFEQRVRGVGDPDRQQGGGPGQYRACG